MPKVIFYGGKMAGLAMDMDYPLPFEKCIDYQLYYLKESGQFLYYVYEKALASFMVQNAENLHRRINTTN